MTDLDIIPGESWAELAGELAAETDPGAQRDLVERLHAAYLATPSPLGGTTGAGLPYPSPTDPIAGGADAIRALAEAVGFLFGVAAVAASGVTTVTFAPAGFFTKPPAVIHCAMVAGTVSYSYMSQAPTAANFTIRCFTNGASQIAGTVYWAAFRLP